MSNGWWGDFAFDAGETRLWRLGPMSLWVKRRSTELRMSMLQSQGENGGDYVPGTPVDEQPPEEAEVVRFGVGAGACTLQVLPATADRALIVRSDPTFIVPPGGETTAFISSPAWMTLMIGPGRMLREDPIQRPSDTWFGPSTITGELCYAVRTSVRFDLAKLPARPHRLYSVVRIQNHAGTPLPLARLRLPLPHLSLYAGEGGRLWTESVTLDRTQDDEMAEIRLGKTAPRAAGDARLVAGPRSLPEKKHLIRSFTGLFGRNGERGYERIVE